VLRVGEPRSDASVIAPYRTSRRVLFLRGKSGSNGVAFSESVVSKKKHL